MGVDVVDILRVPPPVVERGLQAAGRACPAGQELMHWKQKYCGPMWPAWYIRQKKSSLNIAFLSSGDASAWRIQNPIAPDSPYGWEWRMHFITSVFPASSRAPPGHASTQRPQSVQGFPPGCRSEGKSRSVRTAEKMTRLPKRG